jgi:hypothetical protein
MGILMWRADMEEVEFRGNLQQQLAISQDCACSTT